MAEKFETEVIEPEERKAVDYNPLDEQVNEKSYTTPNTNTVSNVVSDAVINVGNIAAIAIKYIIIDIYITVDVDNFFSTSVFSPE
jgi:preprotein translocase subunit SecF